MRALVAVVLLLAASGCATDVKPWERDLLAKREMAWDPEPLDAAFRSHVHFSKEASLPGGDAAGGGCGCN